MGARNDSVDIARLRRRAALALRVEILLCAVAPCSAILAAYLALALFGLGNSWIFAAVLMLALLTLGMGLARMRRPNARTIDRRIEAASGLRHQPLAALNDAPENDSALAREIWLAHQRRVTASLNQARTGLLAPQAAAMDRLALRGLLLLLLLTGGIIAGAGTPARLNAAFTLPHWPFAGPSVNAWITPPSYTGQPPLLLAPGAPISAVAGATLTIITNGPRVAPRVQLGATEFSGTDLSKTSHRAEAVLTHSGRLTIGPWWHRLGAWNIQVAPPGAPDIYLISIEISKGNQVKLRFHVTDEYGLAALAARFTPAMYPGALKLEFPLPPSSQDGSASLDLSNSPYHDLPLRLSLTARNIAGVSGSGSSPEALVLPGLDLHDKTAIAVDHLRQNLALEPQTLQAAGADLQKIAQAPPSGITGAADVELAFLARQMADRGIGAQDSVDHLLALVKELEAGPGYASARTLAAANQALAAMLQRGLQGSAPDMAALQKSLQAIHDALTQHFAGAPADSQNSPGGQQLDMQALDRLAQKIAEDEAAGRQEQAAAGLRQLQKMLAALQSARPMTAAQAAQAGAAAQAAQAIAQMTQGEAALLDKTNDGAAAPGDQAGLQNQLNATSQALAKAGLQLPGLPDAGKAMQAAEASLNQRDTGQATASEQAAIQDLQQAASALAGMQRNNLSIGQGEQALPGPASGQGAANGAPDEESGQNFNFTGANAAREIQRRIIIQDANPALPALVRRYFQKLLDQDEP